MSEPNNSIIYHQNNITSHNQYHRKQHWHRSEFLPSNHNCLKSMKMTQSLLINSNNNTPITSTMTTDIPHKRYSNISSRRYSNYYNNNFIRTITLTTSIKPSALNCQTKKSFILYSTFLITFIVLSSLAINQVQSLNCYHCSSVDNQNCDEAFSGKSNLTLPIETDCYKQIGREAKVCRKIVQYIEHKKVVIRSCGYIDETPLTSPANQQGSNNNELSKEKKPMCYKRSGTFAIMMESCNCYTDLCNHSTSLKPNQSVLLISGSLLILFSSYLLIFKHYKHHS